MRWGIFGLAFPALTACLGTVDGPRSSRPSPGVYHGDHGSITRSLGLESELVLAEDGSFRHFLLDSNTAFQAAKGRWSADEDRLILGGLTRSNLYHGDFLRWDSAAAPDTSLLRNVGDGGFERLELTYDSVFGSVIRWVEYRRIDPEPLLPEGIFEYSETYTDPVDTNLTIRGLTRIEIKRGGHYHQKILQNGYLVMEDVDSLWTQAGTHLITSRNRHCGYDSTGYAACGSPPPGYEYIARLADVGESSFRLWIAHDFSYQPGPFWAEFRKTP